MAIALWLASLDEDVQHMLEAAAARMTVRDVAALAAGLREVDHHDAALQVCIQAAARQPVASAMALVMALRDSGCPIDANRLIESCKSWPAPKAAEFIAMLGRSGNPADAERATKSAGQRDASDMWPLIAELHSYGLHAGAEHLVQAALGHEVTGVRDIIHGLRAAGCAEDASRLLALAAQGEWNDICGLAIGLRRSGNGTDADQLLALAVRRPVPDICQIAVTMRAERDDAGAERLLGMAASTLPAAEIVSLIEFLIKQDPPAVAMMWLEIARRPFETVVDTVRLLLQRRIEASMRPFVDIICARSNNDLAAFIAALYEKEGGADASSMLGMIAQQRSLADACAIASSVKAMGRADAGHRFLEIAAAQSPVAEVVSAVHALRARRASGDAEILIDAAVSRVSPADMFTMITMFGYVLSFRNHDTRRALDTFGAVRSAEDIGELNKRLRARGYHNEADRMMKAARSR